MIHGMNFVSQHGYRVDTDNLDGNPSQIAVVDQSPDGGLPFFPMTIQQGHVMGRSVDPAHVPKRMRWNDRQRHPMPDFDNGIILNVSDRAKQVIETLEPNVHQFLSVEYTDSAGHPLEKRWFLIVCNRIDAVDRANSRMELIRGMMWSGDHLDDPKLVLSEKQSSGYHLWRDKHLLHGLHVSQILADRIEEAGLTGVELVQLPTA